MFNFNFSCFSALSNIHFQLAINSMQFSQDIYCNQIYKDINSKQPSITIYKNKTLYFLFTPVF